ncbi:hypothetical protein LTR56_026357 [Elasticomyces elasticus]|nr:hypothetical protein LTR56_026357 [Elasticomyces elasticus]
MASSGRKSPHSPPTSAQSDGPASATTHVQTVDTQKKSVRISTSNANEYLLYLRDYGVLICRVHGFAVRQLENHLRIAHQGSAKDRREVVGMFTHCRSRAPPTVPLLEPLQEPFEALALPQKAFLCAAPECGVISISRDGIRIQCNKAHGWRSSAKQRIYWGQVWVQTFFNAAGPQRYFTVDYEEQPTPTEESETPAAASIGASEGRFDDILKKCDYDLDKH